jgi:2Fe-2S iron-sulfur cluster protein
LSRSQALFAPYRTLLEVLREDLALTGTKHGCELGECGACAVLVDREPHGLASGAELHPLQAAFADLGAAQCGYCSPGILFAIRPHCRTPCRSQRSILVDSIIRSLRWRTARFPWSRTGGRYAKYATEHLTVAAKRIEGSAGAVKIPHVSPTVQDEKGLALLPSP